MQTRPLQLPGHPVNLAADALALALAVGLPLYFPNGYVGLVGAKFDFLLACLPVAAAAMLIGRITAGRPAPRRRFDPVWLWPVGLCACYALAWWFAEDRYTALWGLSDRKNGLMLYIACTAVYLATAVFSTPGLAPLLSGALTAAGCAATVLSWLNYWMLDPLDAYYVFLPEKGELFLGTVGNINFYGALLCLCLPLAAGSYLRRSGPLVGWRYAAALLLASGLIPAGSDAAWLGCAAALTAQACTRRTTTHTIARLAALLAGLAGCGVLTRLLGLVLDSRSELRTASALAADPRFAVPAAALCLLAAWLLLRRPARPAWKAARIAAGAAAGAAAAAFLAANLLPRCPAVLSALHFDERWAANRGYAWQRLWVIYTQDTTPLQKLIGLGGDAVRARLNPDVESTRYMVLLNGEAFDSAHNEFLQHLVCGGLLGLACWCGFWAAALWRGFKNRPALGAALLGYLAQSLFSISMPGVLPLVFVLAALAGAAPAPRARGDFARLCAAAALGFAALLLLPALPLG